MLTKISFENYKGFEKGELKIKPITMLLGANSVGKSSILHLLLMLQQTAATQAYKSVLKLHGDYVNLGENENIFKEKNIKNDLVISFEFYNTSLLSKLKEDFLLDLKHSILFQLDYGSFLLESNNKKKRTRNVVYGLSDINYVKKDIKELVAQANDNIKKLKLKKPEDEKKLNLIRVSECLDAIDLVSSIDCLKKDLFQLTFRIKNIVTKCENVLKISNISLKLDNKKVIDLVFSTDVKNEEYTNLKISSELFKRKRLLDPKQKKEFMGLIKYNATLFNLFKNRKESYTRFFINESSPFIYVISKVLNGSIEFLRNYFCSNMINYVSPLRAHPKRYYFLDKSNIDSFLDTLNGDSLTEVLKENKKVRERVNTWLQKFNLSVEVKTLQEVIHKLKIGQNNLILDITDVGFGISQVLPVIVKGFLSLENSITIIEQPEIHLHPKMQADLSDLFIDILRMNDSEKKYLLIETHSEYLLRRLRRRISENKISNEEVALYYVYLKDSTNSAIIEERAITSTGAFEWPKDFYSGELLDDTVEFLKKQGS